MSTHVSLHPVTPETRPVLERLWQLYRHDLSEFRGMMPDADGTFSLGRLPSFLEDPDRRAYLMFSDSRVAGFAFVRGVNGEHRVVGEFFVVRAARRQRVGHHAALALFRLHPGPWQIPFQEENPAAAHFWRRVATAEAGDAWHEEGRPVPGKPELPPDVWITLAEVGL
ncbi:GNAT family N-acetyltransferase [Actinopolymorpha alba]|uniref:GNAT family N-acetyltransferase n=1 Tax=Actinopolymorpha alba TaxID=533267 RepID=UPI00058F34F5|nr:GNAT family N-acetyltransferase [Actinopolymorpha alba]